MCQVKVMNTQLSYMLKHDSAQGGLIKGSIKVIDDSSLQMNGKQIKLTMERCIFIPFVTCEVSSFFFNLAFREN